MRSGLGRSWNTYAVLLDTEDVDLALRRKKASLFESQGGLERARFERAYSKVLAEVQRILVEAHHRQWGRARQADYASPDPVSAVTDEVFV